MTDLVQHRGAVTSVVISEDGGVVVSGGVDSVVSIYSSVTGTSVQCSGQQDSVRDVRIIERGDRVLSCSLSGKLRVWNIVSGKLELTVVSGCTDHATCLDVTERDGETLAAVSGVSGGVKIVELKSGQKLLEV